MVKALFGSASNKSNGNQSKGLPLVFACPITTYSTNQLEEVAPLLTAVEAAVMSGSWAVLMLSYAGQLYFSSSITFQRRSTRLVPRPLQRSERGLLRLPRSGKVQNPLAVAGTLL